MPGSPSIHARGSSSAEPSEEAAPAVEDGGQTVTADVNLQSDPNLTADTNSEPSATQSCNPSTALLSPVIVVTQQFNESSIEGTSDLKERQKEVQLGTDAPSATPDSDTGLEVGPPDAPTSPESNYPTPDSPNLSTSTLSSSQSTDVPPAECAQSDPSATPENSVTPDLAMSDHKTEDSSSVQQLSPSSALPPCTDSPVKISLGSLSEAIGCNSAASYMLTMAEQTTDRAVYLTGKIKDNWEMERIEEEKQKAAAEEERDVQEEIKEGEGETEARKGEEEEIESDGVEGIAQTGGQPVNEGCLSPESPAESTITFPSEHTQIEDKVDNEGKDSELEAEKKEDEEETGKTVFHADKEGKAEKEREEALQSPQPMESQSESAVELPLDDVAIIRELVSEIIEVETVVSPCPNSSQTP